MSFNPSRASCRDAYETFLSLDAKHFTSVLYIVSEGRKETSFCIDLMLTVSYPIGAGRLTARPAIIYSPPGQTYVLCRLISARRGIEPQCNHSSYLCFKAHHGAF